MTVLRIEHPVSDFVAWKRTFDSFAERRQTGGVRHYQVLRLADDPNFVLIDLTFDSRAAAEAFLTFLHGIWQSATASQVLRGAPQTRIAEVAESQQL
ncbi:MAG TPA: hypothetical protein VFN11_02095 [Ktedonobacterales bacterium]|nr:hypothetical protein [Ktedonobacterales bacterium]